MSDKRPCQQCCCSEFCSSPYIARRCWCTHLGKHHKAARGVRSAEKARLSTCSFADGVANACLAEFHARKGDAELPPQTVLSGFVLTQASGAPLLVVALGVGTKFMQTCDIEADTRGEYIWDSHAEILARKGLQRFLYCELERAYQEQPTIFSRGADGRFRLRDGVHLHLYTSSQPCGNASVKKWGKSTKEQYMNLSETEWPTETHKRLHVTSGKDGQVAILCKRDREAPASHEDVTRTASNSQSPFPPPGTLLAAEGGTLPCCSARIARWCALGLEGTLLSHHVSRIPLSTVTVGRKSGNVFARRALCCRLQDFTPQRYEALAKASHDGVMHVSMMCTSVKLDDSAMLTGEDEGAKFNSPVCLSWSRGEATAERINGEQGRSLDAQDGVSKIAPISLFKLLTRLPSAPRLARESGSPNTLNEAYAQAPAAAAVHALNRAGLRFMEDWGRMYRIGRFAS